MEKLKFLKAKGVYYWDEQDTRYIDFTSGGIFAGIFGANSSYLRSALYQSPMLCCYEAHYRNDPVDRLRDMLREMTGYESVCLFTTGSEATEAFWRACRVATGKPGIWGGLVDPDDVGKTEPAPLPDAMHGMTLGAMIMAGKMRLPHPGMFGEIGGHFEGNAHDFTGCAIFEPYHAPSAQWHKEEPTMNRVRTNMDTFKDIHFCCDEIQGGLGRTGKLFGHQWYSPEVKPEFVTLGKALGGGLPLSALLGPKLILEDEYVVNNAHLHSTHSGNPAMAAVGCAVLERIQSENLIDESYRKGVLLAELLKSVGVRVHAGRGLLAGVEMAGPIQARKVVEKCREKGLLVVDTGRKWVKIGPAFIMPDDLLFEGCRILQSAIEEVKNDPSYGDNCGESESSGGLVFQVGVQRLPVVDGELEGADAENGQAEGPGGGEPGADKAD